MPHGGDLNWSDFQMAGALVLPKSIFKRVQARFIETQEPIIVDYVWKTCLDLFFVLLNMEREEK